MNGRRARQLRTIAGGNKAIYKEGTPPVYMDESKLPGAPLGMAPSYRKVALGVPTSMAPCSRLQYRNFKKIYKHIKGHI